MESSAALRAYSLNYLVIVLPGTSEQTPSTLYVTMLERALSPVCSPQWRQSQVLEGLHPRHAVLVGVEGL